MAEKKWTEQQQDAIEADGGSLLLSAAAGSGKTAVLVERILRLLTKENDPADPSELLVVTFTNAAACEMRARIAVAVDKRIRQEPENNLYRSIKMKLPDAEISTIDAFCIKLVRENFHAAGIQPDFTLLDSSEQQILTADAMNKTLDSLCAESPEIYDRLNTMTSYNRNDGALAKKIMKLYEYSLSHPFPELWLNSVEDMYALNGDIKDTIWGQIITEDAHKTVDFCRQLAAAAIQDSRGDAVVEEHYRSFLHGLEPCLAALSDKLQTGNWEEIHQYLRTFSLPDKPRAPRGYGDNPAKTAAEAKYKRIQELLKKCAENFSVTTQDHQEDLCAQRPVIQALMQAVRSFGQYYEESKTERGSFTFSDIMHRALRLLVKWENGTIQKTELAYSLQNRFREILIDEYQDTNEAQDMLFTMISKNGGNMFMVGDVKQSIYRFRLAMPEIFMRKSREFAPYDGSAYPAKIILGKNFRSRKGILDNINFLFQNLMSEYAGEMDYTDKEALSFGGGYPEEEEPAVQLRLLEDADPKAQAEYTAKLIQDMLAKGVPVKDGDSIRQARPGDFCILLRSLKGKIECFEKALAERNIKASGERRKGLLDSTEISVFLSLLKCISNPTDDVAMLSLLFSPLYGFTADDVAALKIPDKKKNLYACLKTAQDSMPKAAGFLEDIAEYRRMSAVLPFDIFIRTLLDVTGYLCVVSALKNGEARKLNLIMLCELASDYMKNGGSGLGGFIRYVAKAAENGAQIPAASEVSADADVVRIYTVHKSKGLEFPFVILADCSKDFNRMDSRDEMIISPRAGVGMVLLNNEKLQKYPTIGHTASKLAVTRASLSEELRILYVAMTRAKEKLILIGSAGNLENALRRQTQAIAENGTVSPYAVLLANSYLDWFLMGYLTHPDMQPLLHQSGIFSCPIKSADSPMTVIAETPEPFESAAEETPAAQAQEEIIQSIRERMQYRYPYAMPPDARPKRIASDFEKKTFLPEYFAKSKPAFLCPDRLTPAEAGTANHLLLQNIRFETQSVDSECSRLLAAGILTKKQAAAIRRDKVAAFLQSDLCKRILHAEAVYREKEFTVQISLGDIEPDVPPNIQEEKILVLGKADLVFIENGKAVVVDYKTDRTKTESDFIEAYRGQLDMYRRAMEQMLELPVSETLIYSFELGKAISVAQP